MAFQTSIATFTIANPIQRLVLMDAIVLIPGMSDSGDWHNMASIAGFV